LYSALFTLLPAKTYRE
jgi:hypothetical protein